MLFRSHPRKELILVGVVAPEMEQFLRGRKLDGITLTGALPQNALAQRMSTSHVLALPSLSDGFGMVLAQAMACGCPVIASENSGGPDLIRDGVNGLIIPAAQSEPLRERLQRLADDRALRESMSHAALEHARSIGGWDTYGREYFEVCRELCC